MKATVKKSVCLLLVLCLMSMSVFATDTIGDTNDLVTPRFTYISSIAVGFGIELDGLAYCGLGVTLHVSNYTSSATMTLQRNDGSGWEDVKSWSGTGGEDLDMEEYRYVSSGYEYRTENTVKVYDNHLRLVENVTRYSEIWEY